MEVSDHIVVMHEGRVAQAGAAAARSTTGRPTPFVASFVGGANVLAGKVVDGRVSVGTMAVQVKNNGTSAPDGAAVQAYVRPHDVTLTKATADAPEISVARVERMAWLGGYVKLSLKLSDGVADDGPDAQGRGRDPGDQRGGPGDGEPARRQGLRRGLLDYVSSAGWLASRSSSRGAGPFEGPELLGKDTLARHNPRPLRDPRPLRSGFPSPGPGRPGQGDRGACSRSRSGSSTQILQDLRKAGWSRRDAARGAATRSRARPSRSRWPTFCAPCRAPSRRCSGSRPTRRATTSRPPVWGDVRARLAEVLEGATLQDFVTRAEATGIKRASAAVDDVLHLMSAFVGEIERHPGRASGRRRWSACGGCPAPGAARGALQVRAAEPGRVGQGSHRAGDDRGRRARGATRAGQIGDRRGDVGQHRHRAGAGGGGEGLPADPDHAREHVARADGAAARVRRRAAPDARRAGRCAAPSSKADAIAASNPNAFMPQQFANPTNPAIHRTDDGPGDPAPSSAARPTRSSPASARAARSPASAQALRARHPGVAIIAVEPSDQRGAVGRRARAAPHPGDRRGLRSRHPRPRAAQRGAPRQRGRRRGDAARAGAATRGCWSASRPARRCWSRWMSPARSVPGRPWSPSSPTPASATSPAAAASAENRHTFFSFQRPRRNSTALTTAIIETRRRWPRTRRAARARAACASSVRQRDLEQPEAAEVDQRRRHGVARAVERLRQHHAVGVEREAER